MVFVAISEHMFSILKKWLKITTRFDDDTGMRKNPSAGRNHEVNHQQSSFCWVFPTSPPNFLLILSNFIQIKKLLMPSWLAHSQCTSTAQCMCNKLKCSVSAHLSSSNQSRSWRIVNHWPCWLCQSRRFYSGSRDSRPRLRIQFLGQPAPRCLQTSMDDYDREIPASLSGCHWSEHRSEKPLESSRSSSHRRAAYHVDKDIGELDRKTGGYRGGCSRRCPVYSCSQLR